MSTLPHSICTVGAPTLLLATISALAPASTALVTFTLKVQHPRSADSQSLSRGSRGGSGGGAGGGSGGGSGCGLERLPNGSAVLHKGLVVAPRVGRLLLFSGGSENYHAPTPVAQGRRQSLQAFFGCRCHEKG